MKNLFKYTWPVVALCALAACSDDDSADNSTTVDTNVGKELIAFAQDMGSTTRGLLTRAGEYDTETGFTNTTKIVMRIKSEDGSTTRYSQAVATAAPRLTGEALTSDWCYTDYTYTTPHSHVTYNEGQERYWDDAHGRASKLTVYAVAVPDVNSSEAKTRTTGQAIISDDILNQTGTPVNTTTNPNWYTISGTESTKVKWTVSTQQTAATMAAEDLLYSNNIRSGETTNWGRYHQAHNTTDGWVKSKEKGRLEWSAQTGSTTVGKFDQGHLAFYHALTYLEINLKEGDGFDWDANTDFGWTNIPSDLTQHITLKKFPTVGDLDLSVAMNGTNMWTNPTVNSIVKLKEGTSLVESTTGRTIRTLECYVIPGTTLDGENDNLLEFEIDNAQYYVTGEQIATAITNHDASKTSEATKTMAGKHYIINLTVGKTKVTNITAAVLPWETVNTQESSADNTHFKFDFEERDTKLTSTAASQFDIYRAARTTDYFIDNVTSDGTPATVPTTTVPVHSYDYEWMTGYTTTDGGSEVANKAEKSATSGSTTWSTNWYWENNKTWYHFRAAGHGESSSGDVVITKSTSDGDNFPISHGKIDGTENYKDWLWGAPFTKIDNSYKIQYTAANGFDNNANGTTTKQIAPAIAATHDVIHMLLFHMTSQITVNLSTTTGPDKVVLHNGTTGTTVKIVRFMPTGIVRMGNGKVETTGTRDDGTGATMTAPTYTGAAGPTSLYNFTWGMVPQSLTYTEGGKTDHIGLEITTPDGNTYYVRDLSTITATLANISRTNLKNPYTLASGSETDYVVDAWYPNYKYTYNITLKKQGITQITAAVLPWETVNGNNIDINLEN